MIRKLVAFIGILTLILSLTACSNGSKLTINFSFGERTGKYKGDMVNGLPHGYGEFTSESEAGTKWTYKGHWENGHMHGLGTTEWDTGFKQTGFFENDVITPMSESELNKMFTQPDGYLDYYVELTGYIFNNPEYYEQGIVAVQMYTDIENRDDAIIAYLNNSNLVINDGDMIRVKGNLGEVLDGTNAFGVQLNMPTVIAHEYEIITYEDLHPIIAEVRANQRQTQLGYSVKVNKVEITELETRIYIRVDNNGSSNFSVYPWNTKVIQNGKQYEYQMNYDADYPKVQTDIVPGAYTEGIITYPSLQEGEFKFIVEGRPSNWFEDIEAFTYEIDFD